MHCGRSAEVFKAICVCVYFTHLLWLNDRHYSLFICKCFVEVCHVETVITQRWLKRSFNLHLYKFLLVQISKPRVSEYVSDTVLGAKTFAGVFVQKLRNKVLALSRHSNVVTLGIREVDRFCLDQLVHLVVVVVARVEWRKAYNHLVCKDAYGPPVDRERVAFFGQNFWRQIIWRAAKRKCLSVSF